MQLRAAAIPILLLALVPVRTVAADGEIVVSGAYYKERSTRVMQPMIDARLEVGAHGELRAHTLVDAITSASPASGAAGQPFDEQRYEVGSIYSHTFGRFRIGGGFRFSDERDYTSMFAIVRAQAELAQRNTTVAATLARGADSITNAGAQGGITQAIEGDLDTTLASVTLSQLLSPVLVAGLTYDFVFLDGFQENAYRQAIAGGTLERERVPDRRYRHALFGALRGHIPAWATTVAVGYRFYIDDWGIVGHTPEVRTTHDLAEDLELSVRYRLHTQTRADFYRDIYDSADPAVNPFITADPKLSALTTHTIGGRLTVGLDRVGLTGWLGQSTLSILFDYYAQDSQFGDGVISQLAMAVPLSY